jgi:hypothetical protein
MTTNLHNYEIFNATGRPTPIVTALNSLIKLPTAPRTGLKIRRIVRAIQQQTEDVVAERDRIVELHGTPQDDSDVVSLNEAGQTAWRELMGLTFAVEQIDVGEIEGLKELPPLVLIDLGDLLADEPNTNGATKSPAAA